MADVKYTIRQGESLGMEMAFKDDSGNAIIVDGPDVTNILVTLSSNSTVFAKFSLNPAMGADWGSLAVSGNIITILVTREMTKQWATGFGMATITVEKDDVVLTHLVKENENNALVQIYPSINAQYTFA